ncbi:AAA family ATPase [Streptomyces sp.]|uniref:AAA family ATPase n=1 Tax=Streptomyces sp. TaxID=1931 RepID=UPI002F4208F5
MVTIPTPTTDPRPPETTPAASGTVRVLRPVGMVDVREQPGVQELEYGPDAILVLTGLPGAGKSTLMERCARAPLADSQMVRDRWAARLPGWIGYPLYRPLVRVEHYWQLHRALRGGGPLVIHDSGAQRWVRAWLARTCLRQARPVHLLVLAVDEDEALAGQAARGRQVTRYALARHVRAARALGRRLAATGSPPPGFSSLVVVDRPGAARLLEIRFAPA